MTGCLCALALGLQQRSKFLRESASSPVAHLLLLPSRPRTSSHFHCLPAAATAVRAHTALLTASTASTASTGCLSVWAVCSVCKQGGCHPPNNQFLPDHF